MAKRDLILHNFWWKVTSLLLAVIVWLVVHGTDSANIGRPTTRRVFAGHALAIMRDSTDKRPLRITPTEVDVVVTAPVLEATRLTDADIETFVDLNDVDDRTKTARIRVFLPRDRGVRLERIDPEQVTVEVLE